MLKRFVIILCSTACLAHAGVIIMVFPSPAPNFFGSPSFSGYAANAINALENGLSSVGNPAATPTAYYRVSQENDKDNIVTGFPSWLAFANPGTVFGPAFASELGNRLHFGLAIIGTNGTTFSLSELSFDMESSDPGDTFQFIGNFSPPSDPSNDYSPTRVGVALDGTFITSGPSSQVVKAFYYVGVGNAVAPNDVSCTTGTDQQQIDCVQAFYDSIMPFRITTTYTLTDPSTGDVIGSGNASVLFTNAADAFQVRYASNLQIGDSVVNITNSGSSSSGGAGNICVNVYAFDPSEEMISCCSCLVTPNALQSLSAQGDVINNPLSPQTPSALVIELVASTPSGTGTCDPASPTFDTVATGLRAWGTTLHALPGASITYGVTEGVFQTADLSQAELLQLTSFCRFIEGNGSGFGLCNSCRTGGLGGAKK